MRKKVRVEVTGLFLLFHWTPFPFTTLSTYENRLSKTFGRLFSLYVSVAPLTLDWPPASSLIGLPSRVAVSRYAGSHGAHLQYRVGSLTLAL